jgi:hypothetical protein
MMQHRMNFESLATLLKQRLSYEQRSQALRAPIFILSAPRSGSSMLFERLTAFAGLSNIGGESHVVYRNFPHLRFADADFASASLTKQHADPSTITQFRNNFLYLLQDHQGVRLIEQPELFARSETKLIEKTPRNALNIPFLLAVFPDARFIFLHRKPEENIASLIEAWQLGLQTGRFATFPNLPGWDRPAWCFLLPEGWQKMRGKSLAEIAAFQWEQSNSLIFHHLQSLDKQRWISVNYQDLIDKQQDELMRSADFARLNVQNWPQLSAALPLSKSTLTTPNQEKWRKHEKQILALMPELRPLCAALHRLP